MNDEAFIPKPRLDTIRPDLIRLKTMWMLCCSSPILYLLISNLVRNYCFEDGKGLVNMSEPKKTVTLWIAVCITVLLQAALVWVRLRHAPRLRAAASHLTSLMRAYARRTFIMIAISETVALLGFVLFLIDGRLAIVFAFGLASMLMYAQSYPSERGLAAVARHV